METPPVVNDEHPKWWTRCFFFDGKIGVSDIVAVLTFVAFLISSCCGGILYLVADPFGTRSKLFCEVSSGGAMPPGQDLPTSMDIKNRGDEEASIQHISFKPTREMTTPHRPIIYQMGSPINATFRDRHYDPQQRPIESSLTNSRESSPITFERSRFPWLIVVARDGH